MRRSRAGWWGPITGLALAVTAVAAVYASRVRIDTDLLDLLPRELPASADYREFLERFGGLEKIYVLVSAADPGAPDTVDRLAAAAEMLAADLADSSWIRSVRYGLDDADESFFIDDLAPRALFLVDPAADPSLLERLEPESIAERVGRIRRELASPLGWFEHRLIAADPLGFSDGLHLTDGEGIAVDPATGVFLSKEGNAALLVVTPSAAELDTAAGHEIAGLLETAGSRVREQLGPDLSIHAVGGPLYAAHDEKIIRADMVRLVTGSALTITLLLIVYFQGVRIPLALFLAVSSGIVWTGAFVVLRSGSVSVVGITFAAILLGLGVDYGIHGSTQFRRELLAGLAPRRAIAATLRQTGPAILASVATTAAGFVVLAFARFGPVRELGILISVGIVLILLASVAIGGGLLVLLSSPQRAGERGRGLLWRALARFADSAVSLAAWRPRALLAAAALLSVAAGFGATRIDFRADLGALRPEDHPAHEAEALLLGSFLIGSDTLNVVVQAPGLDGALERADRVARALRRTAGADARVFSPSDLLVTPALAAARIAAWGPDRLRRAADSLEAELQRHGFDLAAFGPALDTLRSAARGEAPPAVPREAWPDWLGETLRVDPQRASVALRVRTTDATPDWPPPEIAAAIERAAPGAALASAGRVGGELRRLVHDELSRLGGWCALVVGIVVVASFRFRLRCVVLAVVPVSVGCLWLLGLGTLLGMRIDLVSVMVAPILLAIGIDDGLHAVHGVRSHGNLTRAVRRIGPAITLTTLTTCLGFGSLILSRVPALRSAGTLVVCGILVCLATTLTLLPALDALGRRR